MSDEGEIRGPSDFGDSEPEDAVDESDNTEEVPEGAEPETPESNEGA